MVKVTERDLAIIAGLAGVADFLTEGRFSAPVARALKRVFGRAAPVAARGAARFVPAAVGTARLVAMRHPYIAAGAVLYVAVTEREKIRTLLEQGYDVVESAAEAGAFSPTTIMEAREQFIEARPEEFTTLPFTDIRIRKRPGDITRFKRKPSAFNKAVSAGMKAIKKSTSYGGKGVIKPAKKAFSVVVKLAAAKKKKKKAPKSGIRRRIWNAMKGLR